MVEYEFFEEGDAIGVVRPCADSSSAFGCYTDAYREEYRCFVKDADVDEASFYVESDPFPDPFGAFHDMGLKMPPSLVESGDRFFSRTREDELALVGAMREHGLW